MSSFLWTGGIPKPHSFFNHQHLHESLIWQRNQKPQVALPALRLHFGHKIFSFPLLVYKLLTQKKAVISLSGFSVCINSSSHATCTYYCIVCEKIPTWLFADKLFGSPDSLPQEHFTVWPFTSELWVATIAWAADSFVENLQNKTKYHWLAKHQTDLNLPSREMF